MLIILAKTSATNVDPPFITDCESPNRSQYYQTQGIHCLGALLKNKCGCCTVVFTFCNKKTEGSYLKLCGRLNHHLYIIFGHLHVDWARIAFRTAHTLVHSKIFPLTFFTPHSLENRIKGHTSVTAYCQVSEYIFELESEILWLPDLGKSQGPLGSVIPESRRAWQSSLTFFWKTACGETGSQEYYGSGFLLSLGSKAGPTKEWCIPEVIPCRLREWWVCLLHQMRTCPYWVRLILQGCWFPGF